MSKTVTDEFPEWRRGEFAISADPSRLDIDRIHDFLSGTYWSAGVPREVVERSIRHSIAFGVYHQVAGQPERQVGFARAITDRATFGYIGDVFVLEAYRGQGLAVWLIDTIVAHPELQGFRNWLLMTRDAHGVYEKSGFTLTTRPLNIMERRATDPYGLSSTAQTTNPTADSTTTPEEKP